MTPSPLGPAPTPASRRPAARIALPLAMVLALYGIDLACVASAPAAASGFVRAFAVPFDLMVCVPVAFYLLIVRRLGISPAFLLPVIALGGGASLLLASPGQFSLYYPLAVCALGVEAAIFVREGRKVARVYREAKRSSTRPNDWFAAALFTLTRNERISRAGSLELAVEWYLLRSWRREPDVPEGCRAFPYHDKSGHVALVGALCAIMLVETTAVHLLVSQWSDPVAWILTLLSTYTVMFLVGDARACVLNPLLVGERKLVVRWGSYFCERIPLDAVASVGAAACDPDVPKAERLNMAAMGARPCWIELSRSVETTTITGSKRTVRWLCVGPDDDAAFKRAVLEGRDRM